MTLTADGVEAFTLNGRLPTTEFEEKAVNAIAWLTKELDRVTAELAGWRQNNEDWVAREDELEAERDAALAQVARLWKLAAFFRSVIKSGEPWTKHCEAAYASATDPIDPIDPIEKPSGSPLPGDMSGSKP